MSNLQFYTDFFFDGKDKLYVKGYDNEGKQAVTSHRIPVVFHILEGHGPCEFKTLEGQPLYPITFDNIFDARTYSKSNALYGNLMYEYYALNQVLTQPVSPDLTKIKAAVIDIENEVIGSGFTSPALAEAPINCVSIVDIQGKKCYSITTLKVESSQLFDVSKSTSYEVVLHEVRDEVSLFNKMRDILLKISPDVLTGWNCEFYDIPYLINRSRKLFGDKSWEKSLSPWGRVLERKENIRGEIINTYEILGLPVLDYMDLYTRFAKPTPFKKLDYIAEIELGQNKVKYSGRFEDFYKKEPSKFVKYNAMDSILVANLDAKLNYLGIVYMLAYKSKTRFKDTNMQIRMWETMIYNWLENNRKVKAPVKKTSAPFQIEGAFVMVPEPALYEWLVTFDVTSLYPSLMMQLNISPETYVGCQNFSLADFKAGKYEDAKVKENNVTLAANGSTFSKDHDGFIPIIIKSLFDERKEVKARMLQLERDIKTLEDCKTPESKIVPLRVKHITLNNTQQALKLTANSCFGALSCSNCMWGSKELGEAITLSGQYTTSVAAQKLDEFLSKIVGEETKFSQYSDTDSIILSLAPLVHKFLGDSPSKEEAEAFIDKVAKGKITPFLESVFKEQVLKMHCKENMISMKRESIADKGLLIAKKNYALHVINKEGGISLSKPKLTVKGLELVRSSTPLGCREVLGQILESVFTENAEGVRERIQTFKKEFMDQPLSKIGKPIGINGLSTYYSETKDVFTKKSTPAQITAAVAYNRLLRKHKLVDKYSLIREGDKVRYVYLKKPNPTQLHVLAFLDEVPLEFGIEQYVDRELQFEKAFITPCNRFLSVIGWDTNEIEQLDLF